jgi:hypothetical protein
VLSATNLEPNALQFFNLLTGVMRDQPVTLGNRLSVGGDLHRGAALQVYGPLEVYSSRDQTAPSLVLDPAGLVWGGSLLEATPSGGLRIGPLEVEGDLRVRGTLEAEFEQPFNRYITRYLRELRPGTLCVEHGLVVGAADPWSTGLTHGQATLVVRGNDLPRGGSASLASFQCWAPSNWLQFNIRFWDRDPSQGWPAKVLTLDFDADTLSPGSAGRISMSGGKVGIGSIADVEGAILSIEQRLATRGI